MILTTLALVALQAQPAGDRALLFHDDPRTPAHEQAIELVRARLGAETETRALVVSNPPCRVRALDVHDELKRGDHRFGWILTFEPATKILLLEGIDRELGVFASQGAKVRSVLGERISDEHRERIEEAVHALRATLHVRGRAAEAEAAYTSGPRWTRPEDPLTPGFEWEYEGNEVVVSLVFEGTAIAEAGLLEGDRIAAVDGTTIDGPVYMGLAIGPLGRSDPLVVTVRRGADRHTFDGRMEPSSIVIPRWQTGLVGEPLLPLPEDLAGTPGPFDGRVVVIHVFPVSGSASGLDLAALRDLRERYASDELAILGLALGNEADVRELGEACDPGFPVRRSAEARLRDLLRVLDVPTTLVIDARGRLRYHGVPAWAVRPAVLALLGER